MPSSLPLGASAAACAVVALLAIPHSYTLIGRWRRGNPYKLVQSDSDHEPITTGKLPRSLWQRVCLVLVGAVGTTAALWWWMTASDTVGILQLASWAAILLQEVVLATCRNPQERYNLGCYSALATLATGLSITVPNALALHREQRPLALDSQDALTIVQLVAALILVIVNLALPRGPAVYRDGRILDAQHSVAFLTRYTYAWAYNTLSLATKNGRLNPEDLPLIAQEVRAQTLSDRFFATDSVSVQWKRWFQLYWRNVVVQVAIQLCSGSVRFLPNFLLLAILRLFEDRDAGAENQLQLWLTAVGLGLSLVVGSWLISLRDFVADLKISLPVNEQLFAVITKKAMGLKDIVLPAGDADGDDDEEDDDDDDDSDTAPRTKHSILNLLGVDTEKISDFIAYSHLLLDCFVELNLTVVFLVYLMGWKATVAGCAIPFLLTPLYYTITKRYSEKEQALMDRRDEKSSSLAEMVRGIRQIKFSALEPEWDQKIQKIRGKELQDQHAVFRFNIYLTAIWTFGPICMSFLSIAAYIYLNGAISPSIAFTALSLFGNLQNVLAMLPEVFTDLLDARVSLRRIARFLGLEDHADDRVPGHRISFADATIAWPSGQSEETDEHFQLRNLNLDFPSHALSIISGRSGAGKSLLLQALIGEADVVKGAVAVPRPDPEAISTSPLGSHDWIVDGMVAYVSQDPWIENASIRDAILFGLPWNQARYDEVVQACALLPDLEILPDGDKTEVGANGINLSGGQKWRLALARALYSRASVLVLDDIFSTVDSHVGRHLYEQALTGSLAEGRTRVLATHHVKLASSGAVYSVKLEHGNVVQARYLDSSAGGDSSETAASSDTDTRPSSPNPNMKSTTRRESVANGRKFYEEEKRETGVVNAKVYQAYINASGGYLPWIMVVVLLILLLLLDLAIPYWVSVWTRSYEKAGDSLLVQSDGARIAIASQHPQLDKRLVYYGSIYLAISVCSWLLDIIRVTVILHGSIKASKELFESFTTTVLHASLRFLDTTPVGQILNRFTSDFGVLDSDLALDLSYTIHDTISILGVIVAALLTSPLVVGLGLVAFAASWTIGYFYVTGAREAKRLDSIAKSPIFELVGSLLTGLPTIRAFGRQQAYLKRMYDLIDTHCQALWHRRLFYCWMSFWLSFVGAVFVASVTMMFVGIRTLDAPLAGFALSFALDMSSNISWLLTQYAQLEINSNAAERIVEYTQLDQEPQSGTDVPAAWPTRGEIEVTGLTVAYAPALPPALKNLNFCIRCGERVGVVGRTGAGKSSLAMTLLRCLDIRHGTIHIDGVDIAKIRLRDLRSRVGMISQDPVVFAGSVREVLDPFRQHDDAELRDALEKVSLSAPNQPTASIPTDIETTNEQELAEHDPVNETKPPLIPLTFSIAEGGKNLSQGQRQLLCLARALVARPKILIMDEATASIDMESDFRIQRALREEIGECTLLVIAHRLSTIADFDRVVVLEQGEVAEMDSPGRLMRIEGVTQELPANPLEIRHAGCETTMNPSTVPLGFWGNLSPVQETRLQQLWTLLLHLAEASSLGALEQFVRVNSLEPARSSLSSPSRPPSRRTSLFSRSEGTIVRKGSRASVSVYHTRLLQAFRDVGLTAAQVRNVRRFLTSMSPEDVRFGVFTAAKHEHPDVYLLRFLRVCKWDVNEALVHFLNSLVWRLKEMQVDNMLLPRGELYAAESETDLANRFIADEAKGFMKQLRIGKGFVHGVDKMNRPIAVVRMRLHYPGEQTLESLNQFVTHLVESARLLVGPPVETATVLFDMTGFSLANMEYAPVKFIIRCFETYYPECLGVLLIHNAPRVFNGVWKIIKPWMDPRIVERIKFTRTVADLETYIHRDQILAELGGDEDWEYEYVEPEADENQAMADFATRDTLLAERQSIGEDFLSATSRWIEASRAGSPMDLHAAIAHREQTARQIRVNYWDLDPYVRARNFLDRTGVIQEGGVIDMYPSPRPSLPVQIRTAKVLQVEHVRRAQVKIVNV
ncbi:hypothetical protein BDW62DRAFT_200085 [Aspergillus aurantiobrunneus]